MFLENKKCTVLICKMIVHFNYFNNILVIACAFLAYCNLIVLHSCFTKKRIWTREIFTEQERDLNGFFAKLFSIIKERDLNQFYKAIRMGPSQYQLLLSLVEKRLVKQTLTRRPIQAECRLLLTLV